jgi:hypothetical protein
MKKNILLGIVLPLLLSAAVCAAVFLPLSRSAGKKYLEYLKMNSALGATRRLADSAGGKEPGRAIAAQRDSGLAIDELSGYGKSLGVELVSLTPGEPRKEPGCAVVPLELEIQAPYKKLGVFLGGLKTLEKSCVVVSSFDCAFEGKDTLRLKAKLSLKMYLLGGDETMPAVLPAQPRQTALKSSYASWSRNPFFFPGEHGASLEDLHLEGILADKKGFEAVIDGEIVGKGEKIKGNTLVDIKNDAVILNDGKKDFELRLAQ